MTMKTQVNVLFPGFSAESKDSSAYIILHLLIKKWLILIFSSGLVTIDDATQILSLKFRIWFSKAALIFKKINTLFLKAA